MVPREAFCKLSRFADPLMRQLLPLLLTVHHDSQPSFVE